MPRTATWFLCFCTAFVFMFAGCGERLVPVKGRITLDGKPVPKGDIWFVPDLDKGAKHTEYSMSKLDSDGRYELTTLTKPGVPRGWYKVVVYATQTEPPASPHGWTPDWIVPVKYTTAQTTDLTAEVAASSEPLVLDFDLQPEP